MTDLAPEVEAPDAALDGMDDHVRAFAPTGFRTASDGKRTTAWVTSDALARDGMILDPDGLDVRAYLRNPVVLWMHGADVTRGDVPIARCVALVRRDEGDVRGWLATLEWETDPFADMIRSQVQRGTLSMTSIGWNTLERASRTVGGRTVPVITRSEMTEFSIVAVGADRNALVVERAGSPLAARLAALEAEVAGLRALVAAPVHATDAAPENEATASAAPSASAPEVTARAAAADVPDNTAEVAAPQRRAATPAETAALVATLAHREINRHLGRA